MSPVADMQREDRASDIKKAPFILCEPEGNHLRLWMFSGSCHSTPSTGVYIIYLYIEELLNVFNVKLDLYINLFIKKHNDNERYVDESWTTRYCIRKPA